MASRILKHSVAALAIAAVVPFGLAACGADPKVKQQDVAAKLQKEPLFKSMPAKANTCIAAFLVKEAEQDSLRKYVDGKIGVKDIKVHKGGDVDSEMQKCVKGGG